MKRLIIIIAIAAAAFWCYNNFNFASFMDNAKTSIQNEKTVKAVNSTRTFNSEQEQAAIDN